MRIRTKTRRLQAMLFRSCNVYYSWKPEVKRNKVEILRSAACRHFLARYPHIVRIPIKTLCFIVWPFTYVRLALRAHFFFGDVVQVESGKGLLRQISTLIWLAWTECVAPRYYYQFCYAEGGGHYRYQGRVVKIEKLILELREESRLEPILLQERLYNHPEICQLTNEYLASIRIVTYLNASGNPCFLAALLLLPHDEITSSNQGRGFPLEPEKGQILSRPNLPVLPDRKDDILRAGEPIVGKTVPYWKEAKALVLKSHRLLPEYFSLGWDVAIGEKGPVILETNIGWDADNTQYFHDLPLGSTEFAACATKCMTGG